MMEKNTQSPPGDDNAWDDALEFVIKRQDNPTDQVLAARLAAWLDEKPEHRTAYQQAMSIWAITGQVTPTFKPPVEAEVIPERMPDAIKPPASSEETLGQRTPEPRSRAWVSVAIAACLLFLLLPPLTASRLLSPADIETGVGEQQQVTLSDGSTTLLSTQTAMDTSFTDTARRVSLHAGEAFFQVTKDAKRPFTVSSALADVTVVGTRFNVNAGHEHALVVTVEEGIVEVRSHTTQRLYRLLAGDRLLLSSNGESTQQKVGLDQIATWRNHEIIVDNWTIGELIQELERYQPGVTTVLGDTHTRQRISGVFHLGNPLAAMSAAVAPFGGKVRTVGPFTIISL